MRPGPGLVVMALAFISGARRGSTSTSSKISSSSTTSSSSSSSTFNSNSNSFYSSSSSSSSSSSDTIASSTSSHSSILFPTFLAGGGVLTSTGTPSPPPSSDYNYYYHNNYPQPPFKLPDKLRHHYDDPRARSELLTPTTSSSRATRETRGARNINSATVGDDRNSDIVARAGGGDNENGNANGNSIVSDNDNDDNSSSSSSNSDSSDGSASEGLLVQFPSHSADSSTSFDEDDILALVAEEDLLSEESFDRLTKLTDDKIGYINEEDYGGVEFGDVGVGTAEAIEVGRDSIGGVAAGVSGSGGAIVVVGERGAVSNSKSGSASESAVAPTHASETAQELHQRDEVQTDRVVVVTPVGVDGGDVSPVVDSGESRSRSSSADTVTYVANLVRDNIATLTYSATNSAQQNSNDAAKFDLKSIGLNSPVFDSTSSLTRINPWLSACDLAQPSTAPDLQVSLLLKHSLIQNFILFKYIAV